MAVVIATRDRHDMLQRCLEALALQSWMPDEVLVVDDGSTPPVDETVRDSARKLPLRVLRQPHSIGPGEARNLGWRSTTAPFVAFTDDDCRPAPGWVEAIIAAAAPQSIVVGPTLPDGTDGPITSVLDRFMEVLAEDGRFSTCNVTYPRAVLEAIGGFNSAYPLAYGEDTDLGQRALSAGAHAVWSPEALVHHAVHRDGIRQAITDRRRLSEAARLVSHHPGLRSRLVHGVFWQVDHRDALMAMAGLALLPLTPAGAAALGRWWNRAQLRLPKAARHRHVEVAKLALIDIVEVAACAWGSLRHRTLLL